MTKNTSYTRMVLKQKILFCQWDFCHFKTSNSHWRIITRLHRFCYASKINVDQPRYSSHGMPSPLDSSKLIDFTVTLYYDNQPINCKLCFNLDHETHECPNKGGVRCFRCGEQGHRKMDCPMTERPQQACFQCGKTDHRKKDCPYSRDKPPQLCWDCGVPGHKRNSQDCQKSHLHNKPSDSTTSDVEIQENVGISAPKLVRELLDLAMQDSSDDVQILEEKLLDKVDVFLSAHNQ
ncbi:unnamed protein product, partial [Owenia fusiformis]